MTNTQKCEDCKGIAHDYHGEYHMDERDESGMIVVAMWVASDTFLCADCWCKREGKS